MKTFNFSQLCEYSRLMDIDEDLAKSRMIDWECNQYELPYALFKSYQRLEFWQKVYLMNIDGGKL